MKTSTCKNNCKLNFEALQLVTKDGKHYLVLSELHKVFNVKSTFISNVSARINKEYGNKYIKKFVIDNASHSRPKRYLEVDGIAVFLQKISYKFEDSVLNDFANYIECLIQEKETPKPSKIVEFPPQTEVDTINCEDEDINPKTIDTSVNSVDYSIEHNTVNQTDNSVENNISNINDVINIMDSVLAMLKERSILKNENEMLKARIKELEQEISNLNNELLNTHSKNDSIAKKATLIRDYVLSNK